MPSPGLHAVARDAGGAGVPDDHRQHVQPARLRVHEGAQGGVGRAGGPCSSRTTRAQRGLEIRRGQGLRGHALERLDLLEPLRARRRRARHCAPRRPRARSARSASATSLGGELPPGARQTREDPDRARSSSMIGTREERDDALGREPRAVHAAARPPARRRGRAARLWRDDPAREGLAQRQALLRAPRCRAMTPVCARSSRTSPRVVEEPDAGDVDADAASARSSARRSSTSPEIEGGR